MKLSIFKIDNRENQIISLLVEKYGIPEVRKDLAVYYKGTDQTEVHLRFRNKKCLALAIDRYTDEVFRPKIHIDTAHTNIQSLLLFLKNIGFSRASVGLATCYSFLSQKGVFVELMLNTFIGNFLQIGCDKDSEISDLVEMLKFNDFYQIQKDLKQTLIQEADVDYTDAISDLNVINKHIYTFAKDINLNIDNSNLTLKDYLSNFNNDYSYTEQAFERIFKSNFLDITPTNQQFCKYLSPPSVIIPCYNSGDTYLKTLMSLSSQSVPQNFLSNLDVILIDDGSAASVKLLLDKVKLKLNFPYRIIRLDPNSGLANARNAGLSQAKHDIVIFLDSDVVLSKHYLYEHVIRNTLIPNAVFVSFKQNVDPSDQRISPESISRGLDLPDISRDSRIQKIISDDSPGIYEISGKLAVEILGATNYFKDLSYGRNIGIYDLPSMVIGHNLSCRKANIIKIGGFTNNFTGWGMEDSFLGARMLAEGNFIIPIISCGVYHIDHPPRSGSKEKKENELVQNIDKYKQLLNLPYEPS